MKPTEHTANTASRSKAGLFATLRGLRRAQGSGALARGLVAAPLLALCVLLALSAGVAQAEPPGLVSYGNFAGSFPNGVAVDESTGNVYVASLTQSNINKFDASGKLFSPPSPFGAGSGFYSGAAVNPMNGDVYVLDAASQAIDTYDPNSGALLSSFSVPGSANFFGFLTVVQIATDSAGDVYVPVIPENEVLEYSPAGTLLNTFTGGAGSGALRAPHGVAVDPSGNLWVASTGNNRIEELKPSDTPVEVNGKAVEIESKGVESLALDGHGDVLAVVKNDEDFCGTMEPPCAHLVEYSSAGVQIADVGAGSFGGEGGGLPNMVAVNRASNRVYVTDGSIAEHGQNLIWIFGPPLAPTVGRELTAEVATSQAKLGALVNPGGVSTTYRFEYDTTEYREGEGPHGQSAPSPEGSVGEGVTAHTVWAGAGGLRPGTTYHYRVVATSELGVAYGPDQTFTTQSIEQAACPNEQLRSGFSAKLPDCRAYELVTTPVETSVEVKTVGTAAGDGHAISFITHEPEPGATTGGNDYVASRGASGWSLEDDTPIESYSGVVCVSHSGGVGPYSEDLSRALVSVGGNTRGSLGSGSQQEACNAEGLQIVPGEPVGYENLLLRDNTTGTYRLINTPPPGVTPADAHARGVSADLSHVVFSERAPLVSNAPGDGAEDLYEWDEGVLRLVTVLPDGTPMAGSLPEGQSEPEHGSVISANGSHVVFVSGGNLYDRIDGERTARIDESQGGTGPSGGGSFQAATADGSKVFFTDESRLTPDSTAAANEPDLYECEIVEEEQAGEVVSKCKLSDLTVAKAGEHADVIRVSGLADQAGPDVYFFAMGKLATNSREYQDAEGNTVVERAENGQTNLYLWHNNTTTFVATLKSGVDYGTGQTSPDGGWFAFDSRKDLTGYANISSSGVAIEEIFLYSAATNQIVCASCNPSGELNGGANIDVQRRELSNGGRMFFETNEALVPSDTNGQADVYEYENGQQYLISAGTSSSASTFGEASENGNDVFFLSRQQLVPQDTEEEAQVIYDARVEGGFTATALSPPCTNADACRSPVAPQPSIYGAPSSQTFSGAGNLAPPAEAKAKSKAKPKKKKTKPNAACKRHEHKHVRCATRARRTGSKVKLHKGGK